MTTPLAPPLDYFSALMQSDAEIPLLEATFRMAQYAYPDLDVQQQLEVVDEMAAFILKCVPHELPPAERLTLFNEVFYRVYRYRGNVGKGYVTQQVHLNVVLHSRVGSTVALGVLWLELARRIGLSVWSTIVSGADALVVAAELEDWTVLLDPQSGRVVQADELQIMQTLMPYDERRDADADIDLALKAATSLDILVHMLRELRDIHRSDGATAQLIAVLDQLLILQPDAWRDRRDRGLAHASAHHVPEALADLEAYLPHADGEIEQQVIAQHLAKLR